MQPMFSIVIPLFNREREIVRALNSCLAGMDDHCEVVVVDDASSDGSVEAVRPFLADNRIKLILNETNKGEWGARTTGLAHVRGDWVIWLDSDDEFLPGGLKLIRDAVKEHGARVSRLGFEYTYDTGRTSPFPRASRPTFLDLKGYLDWYSQIERADALWVTKRQTFDIIPIPSGRSGHLLYAFAFNMQFGTLLLPLAAGLVHTDSENRLSRVRRAYNVSERQKAEERRAECDTLFSQHGRRILQESREAHRRLSRSRVLTAVLAGRRAAAAKNLLFHARYHASPEILALLTLLCVGPRVTQYLSSYRHGRRIV